MPKLLERLISGRPWCRDFFRHSEYLREAHGNPVLTGKSDLAACVVNCLGEVRWRTAGPRVALTF